MMRPRTLALILGIAVLAMMTLMGWVAIQILLAESEDRTALLAQWRIPMLVMGVGIGVACTVIIIALVRGTSAERRERESEAERAFERQMVAQANFTNPTPPAPAAPPASAQPSKEQTQATPPAAKPDLEGLLSQLRLAKLEPMIEGEIYAGPQEGAVILRLGRDETALVLRQHPTPDQLGTLFPRYDRVFSPLANGHWVCTERLEGVVKNRMDLSL